MKDELLRKDSLVKRSFWALSPNETARDLETDIERGLGEAEAKRRLALFGPNVIEKSEQLSWLAILVNQCKSPLILILIFAGGLTLFIGHLRDAGFILSAVAVNMLLGFYQEFKAEKALAELKTYLKQRSRVVREGVEREIDAAHVVPGDCIRLAQGDRIPADARLIFVNDLQIDEAILTGESLPAAKSAEPAGLAAPLADQTSMAFAGTLVTQGIGTALVCRTGLMTELGKIASLVAGSRREETPLQKKIRRFSIHSAVVLGIMTLIIFAAGIALGYSYVEMFLTSVAIAVAAVPEGLPVAMTVILAIGVQRMARRKGVVRKLVAAEALGSTTIILTDKTGTLTQANMALSQVIMTADMSADKILELALLNTAVIIENPHDEPSAWRMNGRVLEQALVRSAARRGVTVAQAQGKTPVISFLPFNAVNKFSASLVRDREKHVLVFFGAADILIGHSTLSSVQQKEVLGTISSLARSGALVVGIATKEIDPHKDFAFSRDLRLTHLSFQGLLTLHDPVRPSARDAIRRVEEAGIKTVIMTGDHRGTAEAIAREVGIPITAGSVLEATDLRLLSDEDLKKQLPHIRVIARVSPLDKMRVVQVLQSMGEVVAMTGDGVNDAPSIKQADIGIAMGSGTEVARDVADLVLLDDNFETIAAAVEEGRQIMHNIRKVLVYLLSSVADGLILIGGALATGLALPLNALQILWVNFFSDSFPAVAFAFEKNTDGFGRRTQGSSDLFTPLMKFLILGIGIPTSLALFGLYWLLMHAGFDPGIVKTFIFASFGSYTLFLAFALRSLEKSILSYSVFSNLYLVAGVGIGLILMFVGIYVPFMQSVLETVPLPLPWFLGVLAVGLLNIMAIEFGKWVFHRTVLPQHKEVRRETSR